MMLFDPAFWNQSIDIVLYQLLVWFGWVPIAFTIVWGMCQVWKNHRQGIFNAGLKHVLLAVDVPAITEQTPKAVENLFTTLAGAYSNLTWKETWILGKFQPAFSFEIVSTEGTVQFFIRCQTKYRDGVEASIYAHYPDAEINEVEDYAAGFPTHYPNDTHEMWGAELTLKKDEIIPLRTYKDFEDMLTKEIKDPLATVLEQLARMRPGEHYWIQILCQVCNNDWQKAGIEYINKLYGVEKPLKEGGFTAGIRSLLSIPDEVLAKTIGINLSGMLLGAAPKAKEQDQWKAFKLTPTEIEQAKAVLLKIGKPGFLTKIRVVYTARKEAYNKGARILFIKGMFNQYSHLNLNGLGFAPLTIPKDDYFWQKWSYTTKQANLMIGYQARSMGIGATPKVFNSEELASLWHFPAIGIKAPLIKKSEAKRAEPPTGLPIGMDGDDVVLQGVARSARQQSAPDRGINNHHDAHASAPEADVPHPSLATPLSAFGGSPPSHGGGNRPAVDEEHEAGLDATDMGPPADVELPGPPPGWREEIAHAPAVEDHDGDGSHEGVPPVNLPV